MPYISSTIPLNEKQDRRRKLSNADKSKIKNLYGTISQRKLAKIFGVSRRTIQFIGNPDALVENKKRREERGGWRQYYDKDAHAKAVRNTRRYKHALYSKGELKMEICNNITNECDGSYCSQCSHNTHLVKQVYEEVTYYFTFNSHFGPLFTNKNFIDLKRQPGENRPHWKAFELWYKKK